jgi:hypothetical protein
MTVLAATIVSTDSWSRGDLIALWSLIIGVIAIVLALFTLRRGNKNSSVASMIPLNAEIRDMWDQYTSSFANIDFNTVIELETFERKVALKLERLMNVLEIAAAIEVEGTLSGISRILMRDYLRRTLEDIIRNDYTSAQVSRLLQDEKTYIYIRRFLRQRDRVSAVLPPKWYAYPDVSWLDRTRNFFRY